MLPQITKIKRTNLSHAFSMPYSFCAEKKLKQRRFAAEISLILAVMWRVSLLKQSVFQDTVTSLFAK